MVTFESIIYPGCTDRLIQVPLPTVLPGDLFDNNKITIKLHTLTEAHTIQTGATTLNNGSRMFFSNPRTALAFRIKQFDLLLA